MCWISTVPQRLKQPRWRLRGREAGVPWTCVTHVANRAAIATRFAAMFLDILALVIAVARLFFGRLGNALAQIVTVHDWYELDCCIEI